MDVPSVYSLFFLFDKVRRYFTVYRRSALTPQPPLPVRERGRG